MIAFALTLVAAPHAVAQSNRDSPLARGLLDRPSETESTPAQRYQTPDGRVSFVMDRSGERYALVRFEGSDEVHVLHAVPGPRGDEFFKTDTGDVLLRVTAHGSVIVYTDADRLGAPAQMSGRSAPMPPPQPPAGGLRARMEALAREAARRLGRTVRFEAPETEDQESSAVVADAAERAAEGLAASGARSIIVRRVVIRYGDRPGAVVADESLTITVAPQLGYAGRPSTAAIRRVVRETAPAE